MRDCNFKNENTDESEFLKIFYPENTGHKLKIGFTKKKANKKTVIHCRENCIEWQQFYPVGIRPTSTTEVICQPSSYLESGTLCILVISGCPAYISGLDEEAFSSARMFDARHCGKLYVMSERAFRDNDELARICRA